MRQVLKNEWPSCLANRATVAPIHASEENQRLVADETLKSVGQDRGRLARRARSFLAGRLRWQSSCVAGEGNVGCVGRAYKLEFADRWLEPHGAPEGERKLEAREARIWK